MGRSWISGKYGEPVQFIKYLPYGETQVSEYWGWDTPYKFSGKEKDEETGYSYFGARYYWDDLSIWLSVDPLHDKRPWESPYSYCGNNPLNRVDPTGMIWDEASEEEVNNLKGTLTDRIADLKSKNEDYQDALKSGTLSEADFELYRKEISAVEAIISNLEGSIKDIDRLGDDQKHTYVLNSNANTEYGYVLKRKDGKISIVGNGKELTIHEITHARQSLDAGKLRFDPNNNRLQYTGLGVQIQLASELEAYQRQFSVIRSDFGSGLNLRSPNEITPEIIGNFKRANGTFLYPAINRYIRRTPKK